MKHVKRRADGSFENIQDITVPFNWTDGHTYEGPGWEMVLWWEIPLQFQLDKIWRYAEVEEYREGFSYWLLFRWEGSEQHDWDHIEDSLKRDEVEVHVFRRDWESKEGDVFVKTLANIRELDTYLGKFK